MNKPGASNGILLTDYQPPGHRVEWVDLLFDLHDEVTTVTSTMQIQRNPESADAVNLWLDGEDLELVGLKLDGRVLDQVKYQAGATGLVIYQPPASFQLEVTTRIRPEQNTRLEGLYKSSGNYCTQCEAEGFRRISYYPDRPDVMARFSTTIEADRERFPVLLSNGDKLASGLAENGRHWVKWADPYPKPSYLFALVAGNLACIEDGFVTASGRKVSLQFYVQHHNRNACSFALAALQRAMHWDEQVFGLEYDLDTYMVVAVDDFNMGAMENKGLNIFNSKYVLASDQTATDDDYAAIEGVIGHEYFHNWTGNRVTLRNWFQLSLKEGLTVFRDQEFSADMGAPALKRIDDVRLLRARQFAEDAGPMSHPVRPDRYREINNFYTLTVYEKGAEVIRMLRTLVGVEVFNHALRLYLERHDGQAVTCEDFLRAVEDASGRNLSQFMRWYTQAGTPVVEVHWRYDCQASQLLLDLSQHLADASGAKQPPMHIPLLLALLDGEGKPMEITPEGGQPCREYCIELTGEQQSLSLGGVTRQPHVSLLRGFSAPVKLVRTWSEEELAFAMAHEDDAFNRWDAAQIYAQTLILESFSRIREGREPPACDGFIAACRQTLDDVSLDSALVAEALRLPSELYLAELVPVVDVDSLHAAREHLRLQLASQLRTIWEPLLNRLRDTGAYGYSADSAGRRRLRNLCLEYAYESGLAAARGWVYEQLDSADNMTDELAALRVLVFRSDPRAGDALAAFREKWQYEPLVIDKWYSIQAMVPGRETLEAVKRLRADPDYDHRNPNRIRALMGAFALNNPVAFHRPDGSGHRFLQDQIIALDAVNPQVAARLVTAFSSWRRFDEPRAASQLNCLRRIGALESLSPDLSELVNRALGSSQAGQ